MTLIQLLWRDQRGETTSMALVLLTTIVALGAIVGLVTLRDQIVQELGDVSIAIESLNQSVSSSMGEYVDTGPFPTDPPGAEPACLSICDGP